MNDKSPTPVLVIAAVFANLINKASFELSVNGLLVLEALQRANPGLKEMSISEIGDYLSAMSNDQIRGLANNVKGIYHELLFVKNENQDGDDVYARIFPNTNHPGADVVLHDKDNGATEIQLKATDNINYIEEHFIRYPDTPILVTTEAAEEMPMLLSTGISNIELEKNVGNTFQDIEDQGSVSQLEDAALMSGIISAAIRTEQVLGGKATAKSASLDTLKDVGAAVSATALLDILFS